MSLPKIHLRKAADAMDRMSNTELQRSLEEVKQKRNARTTMEVAQQQTELASLELEQAAYQLASEAEARGDLSAAARWYTAAASNDFGNAALKLAKILDALAEKHLGSKEGGLATREEQHLVTEACRWYSDAVAAGELEADDLLERLMDRHFGKSRRNLAPSEVHQPSPEPGNAPSVSPTGGPDRTASYKYRARTCQGAAREQSTGDWKQPDLAVVEETHRDWEQAKQ